MYFLYMVQHIIIGGRITPILGACLGLGSIYLDFY
jgi:hypothetical protein